MNGSRHLHVCNSCVRRSYACTNPECASLAQFGACPRCWPGRSSASAMVGRVVLGLALFLGAGHARAESLAVPIAVYGGSNAADLLSTRYLQAHGADEVGLTGFHNLGAQIALKTLATAGEVYLDQKVLKSHETARWIVRGAFVAVHGYVTARNIRLAHEGGR